MVILQVLVVAAALCTGANLASASDVFYRSPGHGPSDTTYHDSFEFAKRHGGLEDTEYSNCFICGNTRNGKVRVDLSSLEFEYTGSLVGTGQNAQGGQTSVVGSFLPQVAVVQVSGAGTYTVAAGSKFTVHSRFGAWTSLSIQDAMHVRIHTSCSIALAVGDQFGPFVITNFKSDSGNGYGCMSNPPQNRVVVSSCVICDHDNKYNKPASLTFAYNAGPGSNENAQGAKAFGSGLFATYPSSTTVSITGKSGGTATQSVSDGERVTLTAPGGKFSAESTVTFGNGQSFEFHTSCSVPLRAGDVYGPLTLLGGGICPVNPCGQHGCCSQQSALNTPCSDASCSNCPTPAPPTAAVITTTSTSTTTFTPPPPPPRGPYCYSNPAADCTINTCGIRTEVGFQFPTPVPKSNCPMCPAKTTTTTTTSTTYINKWKHTKGWIRTK